MTTETHPTTDEGTDEETEIDVPKHRLTVREGVLRLEWWPGATHGRALFSIDREEGTAELVSLDAWRVVQQGQTDSLGWETSLDRVPDGLLLAVRGTGYEPTERHLAQVSLAEVDPDQ